MLTIKRLDIADARILIAGATAKAEELGVLVSIAVADESCNLIAFERMDDTKTTGIQLAIDKAFTAAGIRKGTHDLGAVSQPGKPAYGIFAAHGGRMATVGGGVPVIVDGAVVGAVGVSSATPAQDQEIAEAGIAALLGDA